ncbi:DNA-directed RNA polymerase subunit beta [Enterococcus sp. HY326]|uniref:DNA-directed RNA polymerase subunit beta n=1 Tax=Enterococcus sp. HY326 TaxID=2971265 RepID=UPI00223FD697|nr:DNA-directed RNA polymerase subunit beta [Enterococcus sp. HY326]
MKVRGYIISTLLKIILVIVLMAVFFAIGAMIGFGPIGGRNATGVFSGDLWNHILAFF